MYQSMIAIASLFSLESGFEGHERARTHFHGQNYRRLAQNQFGPRHYRTARERGEVTSTLVFIRIGARVCVCVCVCVRVCACVRLERKKERKKEFERGARCIIQYTHAVLLCMPLNLAFIFLFPLNQALWYRLSFLLNRLPHENDLLSASCVEITSRLRDLLKSTPNERWNQSIPLPEDRALQSLAIFKVIFGGEGAYGVERMMAKEVEICFLFVRMKRN